MSDARSAAGDAIPTECRAIEVRVAELRQLFNGVGWTGGFRIDDKWFGDGRTNGSWRETNVRFEGPAVRQLQAAFVAAWVE
jgi:phosphatidylserine/phosphatidylglycerophosphate/cardiolipin synthase-like enzyme